MSKSKDLTPETSSIIKIIGVGGGGCNAVNHMYKQGIKGVDFIVCNTDKQALDISPIPNKVLLGVRITEGRGAGALPEVGKSAALENIQEIKDFLSDNTKMVFITAGMGGGTGTGAAPIIAKVAKEMNILTVGIVTLPFSFEGKKRRQQAETGLEELKRNVDTLLVISNEKLREIHGNLKLLEAFGRADDVLKDAAKSIAEIINVTMHINVDFADVVTVMKDSGVAIMGSAIGSGENRAIKAAEAALNSPLLNDNNIIGARYVLLSITSGSDEITMDELSEITDYIQDAAGQTAEIIKGYGVEESLGDCVSVTVIATGFATKSNFSYETAKPAEKIVLPLVENKVVEETPVVAEVTSAVDTIVEEEKETKLYEEPYLKIVETPVNTVVEAVVENFWKEEVNNIVEENNNVVEEEITAEEEEHFVSEEAEEDFTVEEENEIVAEEITQSTIEFEVVNTTEALPTEYNFAAETEEVEEEKEEMFYAETSVEEEIDEVEMPVNTETTTPEIKRYTFNEIDATINEEIIDNSVSSEDQLKKSQSRIEQIKQLKGMSVLNLQKMKHNLNDMLNEPAYKRKGLDLPNTPHSSESQISRFTLSEGEDNKTEIKPNNPFLHDNVD